ncbi:MAG: MMPL family transporter [Austwickia sp.]|nr:MMPL family transporter [Actinomycetota bacterium]MCB1252255.1 MMPL family transporter [Austwickia sp.]MCO5309389.1 MMPL family transporter [Austwickia sp.]
MARSGEAPPTRRERRERRLGRPAAGGPGIGRGILAGAILLVIAWLAIGGIGGQSIGKLSSLQKNDNASFLPADAESTRVAEAQAGFAQDKTLPMIIVAERDQALSPADLAAAQTFAAGLPGRALALDNGATIAEYLTSPRVAAVPSKDGRAFLVVLPLNGEKVSEAVGKTTPLAQISATLKTAVEDDLRAEGYTAYVTGPGGFIADLVKAFGGIDGILLIVALGVVLVILLVVYRSPVLPFAVLATAAFGLSAAGFVVYRVAEAGYITVSGQSQGILSILVVGAATDYALLLVARYKEELHDQESTWAALKVAWRATVEPIAASAATVILGLLALTLAELKGTAGLGPVAALGILGALLSALTFLPAVLLLGRRWIFWPAIPRVDHVHRADAINSRRGWGYIARMVGRRPRLTWVVTTVVLLAAASQLPTLKSDGIAQSDIFLTRVDAVAGQEVLAKHFEAGSGSPMVILAPQQSADRVVARLGEESGVTSAAVVTAGPPPGAGAPPTSAAQPRVVDGNVLIQATLVDAADSPAAADTVRRVRADLRQISPQVLVGGQTAQTVDVRASADRDIKVVIPAIIGVVFVVLVVLLRALVAPLLLVLVNVLSFAATMGVSAVLFNHVFKFPGGDPTTELYGFVFLVALGIDYSIFLMTRAKEEVGRQGPRKGVLTALAVTGGVITSAGVVLASTFGALAILPLLFLAQIAFIVAFGVLLDTLVVRSLLVPALAVDLGRWTWWPGAASRAWLDTRPDEQSRHAQAPGEPASAAPRESASAAPGDSAAPAAEPAR